MRGFGTIHPLGGYLPTGSFLHSVDPRVKMLLALLFMIALILCQSILVAIFALGIILAALRLARIPAGHAGKTLRPAIPLLILLGLLQIFVIPQNDSGLVLISWWRIVLTSGDMAAASLMILRLIDLILLLSLFTFVMSVREIIHGTEQFLRPFQRLGFPVHEFSLIITIALRFVPILAVETERTLKAQISRGGDPRAGRGLLFRRVRAMLPLLVPLFLTALRRSETLILAMESRCYVSGRGRTHLIRYRAEKRDYLTALVGILLAGLLTAAGVVNLDERVWQFIVL